MKHLKSFISINEEFLYLEREDIESAFFDLIDKYDIVTIKDPNDLDVDCAPGIYYYVENDKNKTYITICCEDTLPAKEGEYCNSRGRISYSDELTLKFKEVLSDIRSKFLEFDNIHLDYGYDDPGNPIMSWWADEHNDQWLVLTITNEEMKEKKVFESKRSYR